jgi:hypothetical protein
MLRARLDRADEDFEAALRALRPTHDEVTFAAALSPDAVALARALGFGRVGVESDGRGLTPEALAALVEAGATDLHVALYGASARVHDYHTAAGSFEGLTAALTAARALRITAVVTTPLTRSNARSLGEMPAWLMDRGVAAWAVAIPRTEGLRTSAFDRIFPRLALALPYALHALEQARRKALPAWIRGAPWCLLGPYATRSLPEVPRAYGPMCEACPTRARCPGVDAVYLDRFRGDELSPSRVAALTASRVGIREASLARMLRGSFDPAGLVSDSTER